MRALCDLSPRRDRSLRRFRFCGRLKDLVRSVPALTRRLSIASPVAIAIERIEAESLGNSLVSWPQSEPKSVESASCGRAEFNPGSVDRGRFYPPEHAPPPKQVSSAVSFLALGMRPRPRRPPHAAEILPECRHPDRQAESVGRQPSRVGKFPGSGDRDAIGQT